MPIRFIVMMRRILYLWNILHRNEDELVNRFLSAQQIWTSKKDWIQQVRKNMKEINLNLTDTQIMGMSYETFRRQIKIKIEMHVANYLKIIQDSHSKTRNLIMNGFRPADYLTSPDLTKEQVQVLYKLRNEMIDVKMNFGSFHKDNKWCRTCYLFPETQEHLLQCSGIIPKLKEMDLSHIRYKIIFETSNQVMIMRAFSTILKTRTIMIEESTKSS